MQTQEIAELNSPMNFKDIDLEPVSVLAQTVIMQDELDGSELRQR
jgi:hypothetical protein